MSEPIYLDHAAATPILPPVRERYVATLADSYANASATGHVHGQRARSLVDAARVKVANLVGGEPTRVIFVSGTTEANHLALLGLTTRTDPVVTTSIEHASVTAAADVFAACTRVDPGPDGVVELEALRRAVTDDTKLLAVIHGNNETGALIDIGGLAGLKRNALVHVDAAQTARWLRIDLEAMDLDTVALSSHKVGAVKGVAALVCSARAYARLQPLVRGGGQEGGLRPGTSNVPAIDAFGFACDEVRRTRAAALAATRLKLDRLMTRLRGIPSVVFLGPESAERRLPHIVCLRVPGIPATLLQAEARCEVSIATGSACATDKLEPSHVLRAMGLTPDEALEAVRLSISPEMPDEAIDRAADAVIASVRRLKGG